MTSVNTPGQAFRQAVIQEKPLQVVGTINANHALLAQQAGFKALYLSGGGVAAGSLGLPDLGISTLDDVLVDVRRITDVCPLPLLVDVDTGFGPSAFNVARTTRSLIKVGAAALHIEDQVGAKRCGHRPNKEIVSQQEMVDRIKAAVEQDLLKAVPAEYRQDCHHWIILHGRYTCKARTPECWRCPVSDLCRYKPKTTDPGVTT